MIVRISTGHFEPEQADQVERLLVEGGERLVPAIVRLPGLRHYYAGIDRKARTIVNVSVWDTLEQARQMAGLAAMQAEGERMRALGVRFDPIVNHDALWTITP